MATNNTERIEGLAETVNYLSAEMKLHTQQLQQIVESVRLLRDDLSKLRDEIPNLETAAGVLRTEVDELKKARDTWGQRWWQLAAGIALALVGGVTGYLLKR